MLPDALNQPGQEEGGGSGTGRGRGGDGLSQNVHHSLPDPR